MPVGIYQIHIGVCTLRVLVEVFHVRVSGGAVQVVIIFLDVFSVIGLAVGQAERPLLEDRILAVPQRQRKTQPLVIVAETGEAVLAPVISARAGLVVAEIVPGVTIAAVVLADGAPLALTEVRPPLPPRNPFLPRLVQTQYLGRLGRFDGLCVGHICSYRAITLTLAQRGEIALAIRHSPRCWRFSV